MNSRSGFGYAGLIVALATAAMAFIASARASDPPRQITPRDVERRFTPLRVGSDGEVIPITVERLMALNRVPDLSVAVIDHYQIAWTKAYGVVALAQKRE